MAYSFSLCHPVKYAFSFQGASWAKSLNMTAKIPENDACTSQVDQFAVVSRAAETEKVAIVTSRDTSAV